MNESYSATNPQEQGNQAEIVIHVRDRRKPRQYIVDNLIMDEYFPIIGPLGYSIYSLLVRMSNERDGEQARASIRTMCAHLDIGSKSTLSYYMNLLEITGLIFKDMPEVIVKQQGKKIKKKMGNRTNYYYILDVQPVTAERIKQFKTAVKTNLTFNDNYRDLFLKMLDEWQPIQTIWRRPAKRIKTVVGQEALPINFPDEDQDTAPPSPATLQDADATSLAILRRLDITKPSLLQELGYHQPAEILALIWYGKTQTWMEDDRISGYVIKNLGPDGSPPPEGFTQLAGYWLSADGDERDELKECWTYGNNPKELSQDLSIPKAAAKAALKLTSQYKDKNLFEEWLDL